MGLSQIFEKERWTTFRIYCLITLLFSIVSFTTFVSAAFRCRITVSRGDNYEVFIGYWGREHLEKSISEGFDDNNVCVSWSQESKKEAFDAYWRLGRFLGVFGIFIGVPLIFCIAGLTFVTLFNPQVVISIVMGHGFMGISSLLLLLAKKSNVCKVSDCSLGPGAVAAVFDFLLWMVATALSFKLFLLIQDSNVDSEPFFGNIIIIGGSGGGGGGSSTAPDTTTSTTKNTAKAVPATSTSTSKPRPTTAKGGGPPPGSKTTSQVAAAGRNNNNNDNKKRLQRKPTAGGKRKPVKKPPTKKPADTNNALLSTNV